VNITWINHPYLWAIDLRDAPHRHVNHISSPIHGHASTNAEYKKMSSRLEDKIWNRSSVWSLPFSNKTTTTTTTTNWIRKCFKITYCYSGQVQSHLPLSENSISQLFFFIASWVSSCLVGGASGLTRGEYVADFAGESLWAFDLLGSKTTNVIIKTWATGKGWTRNTIRTYMYKKLRTLVQGTKLFIQTHRN